MSNVNEKIHVLVDRIDVLYAAAEKTKSDYVAQRLVQLATQLSKELHVLQEKANGQATH